MNHNQLLHDAMQKTLTTTKDWAAIHFFSYIHKGIVNQTKKFNVVFELPCEWYYYSSTLGIATPSPSPPSSTVPPGSQLVLHTQDEQFAAKLQEQEFAKLRSMEQMEQYDAELARFLQDVEDQKSNVIPPPPSTPRTSRPSQTIINVDDVDDEDEQNDNLESNEDGYRETTCYFAEHPGDVVIVYKKRKRDSI